MRFGALHAVYVGGRAAVRAPRLIAGPELATLLAPPATTAPSAMTGPDVHLATRVALAAVARLARLPWGPWRNTCMYRATAECTVLRAAGRAAVLRLGVARDGAADVVAHAWVECDDGPCLTADGGETARYVVLETVPQHR